MSIIQSDNWDDFTSQVAQATAAGSDVQIVTGPDTAGTFTATVDGGPEVEAPAGPPPGTPPENTSTLQSAPAGDASAEDDEFEDTSEPGDDDDDVDEQLSLDDQQ